MEYKITDRGAELGAFDAFDLKNTFECGQCFRWDENEDGSYSGVVHGRLVRLFRDCDTVIIEGADENQLEQLWRDYFDLDTDYEMLRLEMTRLCPELSRAAEDEAEVSMYVDHIGEEGVYNEPLSGNGNVFEYTFSESCMEYVFYAECTYVYGGYTFTQEIVRITPDVYEVKDITLSVFDDLNDTAVRVDEAGVTGKLNTAENRAVYAVIAANIPSLTVSERNAILNGTYANQEDAYDMLQVDENGNVTFPTDKSGMYEYTVCILKCDDENVDYESVLKDITLHVRYEVLIGVDVELSRDGDGNPVKISKVSDGGKEAFFPDGYFFLRGVQSEYGNVSLEISGNFEYAVSDMGNDIPVGRAAGETGCPFILTGDDAIHYYINHYPDFSVEEIKGDILPNGIDDGEECILKPSRY